MMADEIITVILVLIHLFQTLQLASAVTRVLWMYASETSSASRGAAVIAGAGRNSQQQQYYTVITHSQEEVDVAG